MSIGLAVWISGLVVVACAHPGELWIRDYHGSPGAAALGGLGLCGLLVGSPRKLPAALHNVLLSCVVSAVGFLTRVQPLGDHATWLASARTDAVGLSDLLANVVYRLVYSASGVDGMDRVAPVCGLAFTFLLLTVADRVCVGGSGHPSGDPGDDPDGDPGDDPDGDPGDDPGRGGREATKRFSDAACVLGAWHLMFTTGFVENTQLSLPFVLLAVLPLHAYQESARPRVCIALAALWLGLGAAVHGQTVGLFPALPLLCWLSPRPRAAGARFLDFLAAAGVVAGVFGAVGGGLWLAGFYVHQGHIHPLLFVPPWPHPVSPFTLFGLSHLAFCGNILLLASPLVAAGPLLWLSRSVRRTFMAQARTAPALLLLAWGFCGFSFVILFALRFPRDFDLMLGLGVLLHLFLLRVACRSGATRSVVPWLVLAAGAAVAVVTTASLRVAPVRESALLVNGRSGIVTIRPAERAVLEVRGAGRRFRIVGRPITGRPVTRRPIGRSVETGEAVEMCRGTAPFASAALKLREYPHGMDLELVWDPGGSAERPVTTVRVVPGRR